MADYTPTTEEVRQAVAEWCWSRRMFRPELETSDGGEFDRWLASALAEQGEPEWEFGVYDPATNDVDECGPGPVTRDSFTGIDWDTTGESIVRRRVAGPWLPVEENAPESTDGSAS